MAALRRVVQTAQSTAENQNNPLKPRLCQIKAKSPFKDTFTIELANGANGYLPTPRQHDLGGYETWLGTNRVEREASVKITARALEMLQSVHAAP